MTSDAWPKMAEPEYDADGKALEGTVPIVSLFLLGCGPHNEPIPAVEAAGCAYCDRWAVGYYASTRRTRDGALVKTVTRRMDITIVYACNLHLETASRDLVAEHGSAVTALSLDLAHKVGENAEKRPSQTP